MSSWGRGYASWRSPWGSSSDATVIPSLPCILKIHGVRGPIFSGLLPLTKFWDAPSSTLLNSSRIILAGHSTYSHKN
jgi:hypothetical protein